MTAPPDEISRKIFSLMKMTVESWGGKLYVVHFPAREAVLEKLMHPRYDFLKYRGSQYAMIESLGVPVIELYPEFIAHHDVRSLWHYRSRGHFNAQGYRFVAGIIRKRLLTFSILKDLWKVIYSGLSPSRKKVNTGFSNFFVETNTAFHKFDLEKACIWSTFDPLLRKRPIEGENVFKK